MNTAATMLEHPRIVPLHGTDERTSPRYRRIPLGPLDMDLPPERMVRMALRRLVREARAMGLEPDQVRALLREQLTEGAKR